MEFPQEYSEILLLVFPVELEDEEKFPVQLLLELQVEIHDANLSILLEIPFGTPREMCSGIFGGTPAELPLGTSRNNR